MKAVTFIAPQQAELRDAEPPSAPLGPLEVGGRTLFTMISPGTELAYNYQTDNVPNYPGYAAVFEVDEVGSEVTKVKPGDAVFCLNPHRSRQRTSEDWLATIPGSIAPRLAPFARLMGVSLSTLVTTKARPGETVLVTGLGIVGNLAAQMFASCGYQVVAVDPDASRRAIASRCGLKEVLAAAPDGLDDAALALECSGHEAAVLAGINSVRKGGEVVLTGVPWVARTDMLAHKVLHAVFHRYVVVRSGWEWELPMHPEPFRVGSIWQSVHTALNWIAEGRMQLDGLAEDRSPEDCGDAYRDLANGRVDGLTIRFDWS